MFSFASNLKPASESDYMIMMKYHADRMIPEVDNIVISLGNKNISKEIKENLIKLGKIHYHHGIKYEYMIVYFIYFKFELNYYIYVYL